MRKITKDMMVEGMSTSMITIVMEDIQVEANSLGIEKIYHNDRSSVIHD